MMNAAEFANIAAAEHDFWWYEGMRRILFSLLDPLARARPIRTVLDAGCGTGFNARTLEQRYGWHVYPLDLQMEGLAYAQAQGIERLVQGDVTALPFRTGAFDAVVSLDVMVHLPRGLELRALREMSRVIVPGGLLIVRVAAFDFLRSRHSEFTTERQRYTAGRLVPAVAETGIHLLRSTYANTLLLPIAFAKFRIWEPLTRGAPVSGVQLVAPWLNRLLMFPLSAESRWLGAGLNLPLGQSLIVIGEKEA
jgi:SAM-dependent methyltransferase